MFDGNSLSDIAKSCRGIHLHCPEKRAFATGVMVGYPFDTVKVCGYYKGMTMTYRNSLRYLCKLMHGDPEARPAKCDIFLSGLTGGVAQVLLVSPKDMVKLHLHRPQREQTRVRFLLLHPLQFQLFQRGSESVQVSNIMSWTPQQIQKEFTSS
ncbi:solute carrier family 25 member 47-like [Xiphias gladius]|uniref:solute carrier family 25 member 47-like n=1 Tax=Xiphias gladius TaxID=8245 RepID=UPI001A999B59|nr:solute carrier family 25 member 47-like [Xiphias gladius]